MTRTGRRSGESGTRAAILAAARAAFAEYGYDTATIRDIDHRAGVDPALLHHFYGSKEQLFTAAMDLPVDPTVAIPALFEPGDRGEGERLVRYFLGVSEAGGARSPFLALLHGAVSHQRSASMPREFIRRVVVARLAAAVDSPDGELRATLIASQMVGWPWFGTSCASSPSPPQIAMRWWQRWRQRCSATSVVGISARDPEHGTRVRDRGSICVREMWRSDEDVWP